MACKYPKSNEFIDSDEDLEVKIKIENSQEENSEDFGYIPHASISKAPKIFAKQFKATIFPKIYDIELERETFFEPLKRDFEDIELIVSKEDNQNITVKRANYIIKVFADFGATPIRGMKTPRFFSILEKILRNSVGDEKVFSEIELQNMSDIDKRPEITIETVKCKKKSICWATIDYTSRFTANFDPSMEFSEPYRIYTWARVNVGKKFSLEMPFVQNSRWSHTRLKTYLEEFKNNNHTRYVLKRVLIGPFNDWRDIVIKWWNDWITEGWYHKRPQLFLVSRPNCGKTTFVRDVLFRAGQSDEVPPEAILIPERAGCKTTISNFALQKANSATNSTVFCDEFDSRVYNVELLKIVLQGDFFSATKKYVASGDDMCLRIPMIFASNHMIPDTEENVGLAERFLIVKIPENFKAFTAGMEDKHPYKSYFENEGEFI